MKNNKIHILKIIYDKRKKKENYLWLLYISLDTSTAEFLKYKGNIILYFNIQFNYSSIWVYKKKFLIKSKLNFREINTITKSSKFEKF